MRFFLPLFLVSCAKNPQLETQWKSSLSGGLLVSSSIVRTIANEADSGDGSVGCVVGSVLGSVLTSAGYQIAALPRTPTVPTLLDFCDCLALRDDWDTVNVSSDIVDQTKQALEGVSLLVSPHIHTCEGQQWFSSISGALSELVVPVSESLRLDSCVIPIPSLSPDLSVCDD